MQPKIKCMILQKAKGYLIKVKYQTSFSQWDVVVTKESKRSNVMIESGATCKAPSYVIKFCGRSYMHTFIIEMGHII